jgi:hypothetical protein
VRIPVIFFLFVYLNSNALHGGTSSGSSSSSTPVAASSMLHMVPQARGASACSTMLGLLGLGAALAAWGGGCAALLVLLLGEAETDLTNKCTAWQQQQQQHLDGSHSMFAVGTWCSAGSLGWRLCSTAGAAGQVRIPSLFFFIVRLNSNALHAYASSSSTDAALHFQRRASVCSTQQCWGCWDSVQHWLLGEVVVQHCWCCWLGESPIYHQQQ